MFTVIIRYLLSPVVFSLTVLFPVAVYIFKRRYVWFTILFTVLMEVIINWDNFCYYESRGLMILFTLVQIAVMAFLILILKVADRKR